MKKILAVMLVLLMSLMVFSGCGDSGGKDGGDSPADLAILGTIYTAEADGPLVTAAAVKDGVYVYVGDEDGAQPFIGEETEVINLEEGMAMPSFGDGHTHGHQGGVGALFEVHLYECETIEEYQETIRAFMNANPDLDFIYGSGWLNGYFPNGTPTADLLDEVSEDIPIALVSGDHHSYWVNSKALEVMGVDRTTPDIEGGVIERDPHTGDPLGTFRENANSLVTDIIPEYSVEQLKEGILAYQKEAMSYGITAYFEPFVSGSLLEAYNQLDEAGELLIRVFGGYGIWADRGDAMEEVDKCNQLKESTKGGLFSITAIKLLIDGVVEGRTAYLLEDYADEPGYRSEPLWPQDALNEMSAKADSLGLQLHYHAIGDGATEMSLDALEYAREQNGPSENRHVFTHLQVIQPDQIARMADLQVIASVDPYWFCKEKGLFHELELPYLGEERANREYPLKSFFDSGITVSMASDYPVTMPAQPMVGLQAAVTRCNRAGDPDTLLNPDERVTVEQMLPACTINVAYQNFSEKEFGSVKVGKSADMMLLDQNLLETEAFDISKTKVLQTIFKGQTIYEAK